MKVFVPLLMIASLTVGPILIWKVATWIARPLDLAAKNRRHATQFTIVDFFCLFVLVQAPTALIHSIKIGPGMDGRELYVLDAYAWLAVGLIWWKCAEIMSRAGINTPWHRVVLLVFVLPVALVGPLLPLVFVIVVAIGMLEFSSVFWLALTALLLAVSIPAAMLLCAHLVRSIVASSEAVTELVDADGEGN